MAKHLLTDVGSWQRLPAGLRRRARQWWRWGHGVDAAAIEPIADEFAAGCRELRDVVDSARRERWQLALAQFGFLQEAADLAATTGRADRSDVRVLSVDRQHAWLERLRAQVSATFERNVQALPDEVSADDGRCQALLDWARSLSPAARVADLGCGSGRFLHVLEQRFPDLNLIGVDVAAQPLSLVKYGIERIAGGLLNLPLADHALDAVYAIESLEHALRPRRALMEMLRVLRPGGRLCIIDKNRAWQARSEHEAWERWFDLQEMVDWLSPHADVACAELLPSDGRDVPAGLFCFWSAIKRG